MPAMTRRKGGIELRGMKARLSVVLMVAALLISVISVTAYGAALDGWMYEMIGFAEKTGLAEVRVALIDTGVSTKRINAQQIEPGTNYVFEGADTEDLNGHGTRVASLILGCADEEDFLYPLAANARLIPLVYHSRYASGVPKSGGIEAICMAIYDAVDLYGCKVINISSGIMIPDDRLEAAVKYAEENNVIVVSAVGNDNIRDPERQFYPAAYDTVVGVGAVNSALEPSAFSQRNGVTVCAPGENITAASIKNSRVFETVSGTSYATAFVTALAASMLGEYPDMTPLEFREILENSCRDIGPPGYDADSGYGVVNFQNAFDYYEEMIKKQGTVK